VDSAILNTAILFQQNWMTECSA